MTEPRTETGKRLLAQTLGLRNKPEDILAIEAEAAALSLDAETWAEACSIVGVGRGSGERLRLLLVRGRK